MFAEDDKQPQKCPDSHARKYKQSPRKLIRESLLKLLQIEWGRTSETVTLAKRKPGDQDQQMQGCSRQLSIKKGVTPPKPACHFI